MIGKTDKNPQLNVFRTPLVSVINMKHELVELAQRIDWKSVEKDFEPYYADMGRPAVPVRKMVGCMLLKQMYGLSDESFVDRWIREPVHAVLLRRDLLYIPKLIDPLFRFN